MTVSTTGRSRGVWRADGIGGQNPASALRIVTLGQSVRRVQIGADSPDVGGFWPTVGQSHDLHLRLRYHWRRGTLRARRTPAAAVDWQTFSGQNLTPASSRGIRTRKPTYTAARSLHHRSRRALRSSRAAFAKCCLSSDAGVAERSSRTLANRRAGPSGDALGAHPDV